LKLAALIPSQTHQPTPSGGKFRRFGKIDLRLPIVGRGELKESFEPILLKNSEIE
jgi:hypothetical protein